MNEMDRSRLEEFRQFKKEIVLAAIDLRFEQHSEGASPAFHGQIH